MALLQLTTVILVSFLFRTSQCSGRREWRDNFYEYTVKDIDGRRVRLEKYRGMPSLVVNVASDCGYTDRHYRDMVRFSKDPSFKDRLNILAFPCNQFGYQEPMSDREIKHTVQAIYNVEFPLFAKVDVIGYEADPAWEYLTREANQEPTWNFWKYLVDSDGYVKGAWGPDTSLDSLYGELLSEAIMSYPHHAHYHRYDDEF